MKSLLLTSTLFLSFIFLLYSPAVARSQVDSTKTAAVDSVFTISRKDLRGIIEKLKGYQIQLKAQFDATEGKIELIQEMLSDTAKVKR